MTDTYFAADGSMTNRIGEYGRVEFTSMYRSKAAACAERSRGQAPCTAARFIESTPSTGYPKMPAQLASLMPAPMLRAARFVLIAREPVERMLSWYNHNRAPEQMAHNGAPWEPCAKDGRGGDTFDGYVQCKLAEAVAAGGSMRDDHGDYGAFIDALLGTARVARRQLLLLEYKSGFADAAAIRTSMRAITVHYGGPVLDRVTEVPASNAKDYPQKLVQIRCSTRAALGGFYAPRLQRMYAQLDAHYAKGLAPPYEPRFRPFALDVPCGADERSAVDADRAKAGPPATSFWSMAGGGAGS